MTREEAHTLLEVMAIELTGELADIECPVTERTKLLGKQLEAIDMAIEALSVANLKEEFESADAEFTDLPDIPRYYYEKVVGNMAHEINMLKEQLESADAVEVVRCKDCKFKRLYDDGDTKYYYCALEDRPNRNWSVDDTDYCSWGER